VYNRRVKILERPLHPTTDPGYVWVYRYLWWDADSQSRRASAQFATLDGIHCGLGVPIMTSGKKVAIADLVDGAFAD